MLNNLQKANQTIKHKIETQEISLKHTKKNNHKEKKTQKLIKRQTRPDSNKLAQFTVEPKMAPRQRRQNDGGLCREANSLIN